MSATSLADLAVRRSLPDAESIISRFNAELRVMIPTAATIACSISTGFERTSTATGSPTPEPGPKRRFYFGGNIYEG